jgi:hypothetical protein
VLTAIRCYDAAGSIVISVIPVCVSIFIANRISVC